MADLTKAFFLLPFSLLALFFLLPAVAARPSGQVQPKASKGCLGSPFKVPSGASCCSLAKCFTAKQTYKSLNGVQCTDAAIKIIIDNKGSICVPKKSPCLTSRFSASFVAKDASCPVTPNPIPILQKTSPPPLWRRFPPL